MKLTPEQIEQNAAAYVAFKTGKPWQWSMRGDLWFYPDADAENAKCVQFLFEEYLCRPAPEPPEPWSLTTKPRGVVWVRKIGERWESQITAWNEGTCLVAAYANVAYSMLLSDFEQLDGSPCGIVKEAK